MSAIGADGKRFDVGDFVRDHLGELWIVLEIGSKSEEIAIIGRKPKTIRARAVINQGGAEVDVSFHQITRSRNVLAATLTKVPTVVAPKAEP